MAQPYFQIYQDTASFWRWRLVAGNNEKVAASEAYVSRQGAQNAVDWMRAHAATAPLR